MPASSASSRVGGSFSPAGSSPDEIAWRKAVTICSVTERSPPRFRWLNLALYDTHRPIRLGIVGWRVAHTTRSSRRGRSMMYNTNSEYDPGSVTIRAAGPMDGAALRRIAQRDSRAVPDGELLLAEVNGEAQAAIALETGEVVADPFRPTLELVRM